MSEEAAIGRGAGLLTYMHNGEARQDSRKDGDTKSWTRNRDLPLPNLLVGIMDQAGLTGAMEIRRIFEKEGKEADRAVSNQDYLARRRLLNPKVFKVSNRIYLAPFYAGHEPRTWHGNLLLAVDGSKFEIANSRENHEKYGSEDKASGESVARCLYGALNDVLNGFIVRIALCGVHGNEKDEAKENIGAVREIIGERKAIMLFDRNYPSLEFLQFIRGKGFSYIIRLRSTDYKAERTRLTRADEEIEIEHSYERMHLIEAKHPESGKIMREEKSTHARIIKMRSRDGEGALITNLGKEYKARDLRKLYGKRWEVEKRFHTLKNKMRGEYNAGKNSIYVEQDFWASVLVHNMIHDLMNQANRHVARNCKKKGYKYKMHVNENIAIGHFKDQFVNLVMIENDDERGERYKVLWADMQRYVLPYRNLPSRQRKWNHANKYKQNLKPSY
jgi:hypothetical protein